MEHDVVVVGAGLAGLAAGLALADARRDVLVLEAAREPGGFARADEFDGYALARGPQSFMGGSPALAWLCERAGCSADMVAARGARRRFIWRGRLHELPASPLAFATSGLLTARGKARLLAEPFVRRKAPAQDESVAAFFARRLGAEAADALIAPFVSGVHAGDASELEAQSAFPRVVSWERAGGSIARGAWSARRSATAPARGAEAPPRRGLFGFARGLQRMSDASAAALGDRLRLGARVRALVREGSASWRLETDDDVVRARRVVLALPPHAAADLVEAASGRAASLCRSVPMAPVAVVHHGGRVEVARPEGFGVLLHPDSPDETLGIVFSSSLFPTLAPEGAWLQAAYVGGRRHARALELDDATLLARVAATTRRVLGFAPPTDVTRVIRHERAIPQMIAGHADRMRALRDEAARLPGLVLAGAWIDGIGLEAAAASGRAAALQLAPARPEAA